MISISSKTNVVCMFEYNMHVFCYTLYTTISNYILDMDALRELRVILWRLGAFYSYGKLPPLLRAWVISTRVFEIESRHSYTKDSWHNRPRSVSVVTMWMVGKHITKLLLRLCFYNASHSWKTSKLNWKVLIEQRKS